MPDQQSPPETGRLSPDFQRRLPIASEEEVEYSEELAGPDDKEAQERARQADRRARSYEGE